MAAASQPQCRHQTSRAQSTPCGASCKRSLTRGRSRRRCSLGRRRRECRICRGRGGGRRSCCRLRPLGPRLPGGFGRRRFSLKLRDDRIWIDVGLCRRHEVAVDMSDLDRHGGRLELFLGEGYGEPAVRRRHRDRAGSPAALPNRGTGIGALRRRIKLDLHRWRSRLKRIPRKRRRRTAGEADACYGNHDNTTHDPSTLDAANCHNPPRRP